MKYLLVLALLPLLACCDGPSSSTAKADSSDPYGDVPVMKEHGMTCTDVARHHIDMYRCENDEIVCYTRDGISCHWKAKQ